MTTAPGSPSPEPQGVRVPAGDRGCGLTLGARGRGPAGGVSAATVPFSKGELRPHWKPGASSEQEGARWGMSGCPRGARLLSWRGLHGWLVSVFLSPSLLFAKQRLKPRSPGHPPPVTCPAVEPMPGALGCPEAPNWPALKPQETDRNLGGRPHTHTHTAAPSPPRGAEHNLQALSRPTWALGAPVEPSSAHPSAQGGRPSSAAPLHGAPAPPPAGHSLLHTDSPDGLPPERRPSPASGPSSRGCGEEV